jgi:hypothetical protein
MRKLSLVREQVPSGNALGVCTVPVLLGISLDPYLLGVK